MSTTCADLVDGDRLDLGRTREWQMPGERGVPQRGADLRQPGASPAQVQPAGQHARLGELLEHQLDAGRPDCDVLGDDLGDLVVRGRS